MPECVLQAYLDQIPRLRAERALVAAQVASLPWMKEGAAQRWYEAQQAALAPMEEHRPGGALFTWNGRPLQLGGLKRELATALGGGFSG